MPRNGVGIYSPPSGINPVVHGTTIDTTWANPTIADISAALTGSLARDGQAPMTGPLKLADGTVGSPGISWNSDSSTGFFRPTAGALGITVSGVERVRVAGSELTLNASDALGSSIVSKISNVKQWAMVMAQSRFTVRQFSTDGETYDDHFTIEDGGFVNSRGPITVSTTTSSYATLSTAGGAGALVLATPSSATASPTIMGRAGSAVRWSITLGNMSNNFTVGRFNESGALVDFPLTVNGTTGAITASNDIVAYSDARLKKDVEVISNPLGKVGKLRGVTFTRTDTEARGTGVIAQEVEKVLPEAVSRDDKGILAVAYGNMVGLLIEAVKELTARVKALEAR